MQVYYIVMLFYNELKFIQEGGIPSVTLVPKPTLNDVILNLVKIDSEKTY